VAILRGDHVIPGQAVLYVSNKT